MRPKLSAAAKRRTRVFIAVSVVLITIGAFVYYLDHHRSLITQLAHTPPALIVWLLILYGLWFGALGLIMHASLLICKRRLGFKENLLLNAYSSLVNFFVPGQGGIAVRGAYLKRLHKLKVRNYIYSYLLYYMFYAIISALMLFMVSRPWWQTTGVVAAVALVSFGVITLYNNRAKVASNDLDRTPVNLSYMFLATIVQAIIQVAIYALELHRVNGHITLGQMITYTGAANFALFVSLTPGAIGIRESFLVFSHRLHHISDANIISANVIDRSVFIVFLGIMFLVTLGFHARNRMALATNADSELNTADEPSAK